MSAAGFVMSFWDVEQRVYAGWERKKNQRSAAAAPGCVHVS